MPLSVGDKLIGAGGMGEVYGARDTLLGRDVAIKVSQEKFSDRLEREASRRCCYVSDEDLNPTTEF